MSLLQRIKEWFTPKSDLERYLETKGPSSPAEVEHWIKQFEAQRQTQATITRRDDATWRRGTYY